MKIKANDGKVYDVPDYPNWCSGPPPDVGWWPASRIGDAVALRFWNGHHWSEVAKPNYDKLDAAYFAKQKSSEQQEIRWAPRWWLKGKK